MTNKEKRQRLQDFACPTGKGIWHWLRAAGLGLTLGVLLISIGLVVFMASPSPHVKKAIAKQSDFSESAQPIATQTASSSSMGSESQTTPASTESSSSAANPPTSNFSSDSSSTSSSSDEEQEIAAANSYAQSIAESIAESGAQAGYQVHLKP